MIFIHRYVVKIYFLCNKICVLKTHLLKKDCQIQPCTYYYICIVIYLTMSDLRTDLEKVQSNKTEEMSSNPGSTMSPETARKLKYLSLLTLTAQNAILGLSMRYSRTRPGDLFYEATAVLMAEFVKFFTCLWLVYKDVHYDFDRFKETLYVTIWVNKMDTIKVSKNKNRPTLHK